MISDRGYVEHRVRGRGVQRELFAEPGIGHRVVRNRPALLPHVDAVCSDPLSGPIVRVEQAHRPQGGLAPGGERSRLVANPRLPVASRARRQRPSRVNDVYRLTGRNFSRVPEVAPVFGERLETAADEHLIRRLPEAASGSIPGSQTPTQPRLFHVDAPWILQVLTPQVQDVDRGGRLHRSARPCVLAGKKHDHREDCTRTKPLYYSHAIFLPVR